MSDDPKYDVAISFLSSDEDIARELFDKLTANGFKVFFYPRRQEELAGTDGMETMRTPFLDARVALVLYREPWGQTPWTRVEETAIQDRCLGHGWDALMFATLDKTNTVPKWLPKAHVRFSVPDFGLEQLVGATTLRVQEQGGTATPPDAMTKAKLVKREADYLASRSAMMRDQTWIQGTVHKSLQDNFQEVLRLVKKANDENGFVITAKADSHRVCVLRHQPISLGVMWHQPVINNVEDDTYGKCGLSVKEFSGSILFPGERGIYVVNPILLAEHVFKVSVSQSLDLIWIEQGKRGHLLADKLADRIVMILFDLIARAQQGKVRLPSFGD